MAKYRFKTKEEFENEFGNDWRSRVKNTWWSGDLDDGEDYGEPTMDVNFGLNIPEEFEGICSVGESFHYNEYDYSSDMYKEASKTIQMADGAKRTFNGLHKCVM